MTEKTPVHLWTNNTDEVLILRFVDKVGSVSAIGKASVAVSTGADVRARAGEYGCIALAWWNSKEERYEMRSRETGCGDGSDGKLKSNVWYILSSDGNEFVEVQP